MRDHSYGPSMDTNEMGAKGPGTTPTSASSTMKNTAITRVVLVCLVLVSALVAGLGVTASPASAAVSAQATTRFIGGGATVNIRTAPSVQSTVAYVVNNGAPITIECQLVGGKLGFSAYAENRTWNKLTNGRYIHDAVTTTPADQARVYLSDGGYVRYSSNIPRCGSTPAASLQQSAANNARSTVGYAYAQSTGMAGYFSASSWSPGPYGEWSYDCVKAVRAAYLKAGYTPRSGATATAMWQAYGSPRRTDAAPVGAFLFWPNINHVAIVVSPGVMVSTMGRFDGDEEPNALLNIGEVYGQPTGWAMP